MAKTRLSFVAISEPVPGRKWKAIFDRHWHAYSRWFLQKGSSNRASYLDGLKAMKEFMPELVRPYQDICEVAGGGDLEARFLSMWCPPAYVGGCSQVTLPGAHPLLLRNYDYSPQLFEGTWFKTKLADRDVIAVIDCLWGALDGINEDGLAVSLAFGGRPTVGTGFGIPIVVRYLLECAATTAQAVKLLQKIPVHMSYSLSLLDKQGKAALVYVGPDRETEVVDKLIATNHQHSVDWPRHATATLSLEREKALQDTLARKPTHAELLTSFQKPPLRQNEYGKGYGTLYTAVYDPKAGSATLVWPGRTWQQSFDNWTDDSVSIDFEN